MKSLSLVCVICLLLAPLLVQASTIEFRRSSSTYSTSMSYNYYDEGTGYYTLLARVPGAGASANWQRVCRTSSGGTPTTATAQAICKMIGRQTSIAAWDESSSTTYGITGLDCSTQSGNATNFNQCSYTSSAAYCAKGYLRLRCGSLNGDDATHGTFIAGTPELFIRRRWNQQVQVRQIFSTTWKNVGLTSGQSSSVYGTANLCRWAAAGSSSSYYWRYSLSASPVLDASAGFGLADVSCTSAGQDYLGDPAGQPCPSTKVQQKRDTSACSYKSTASYSSTLRSLDSSAAIAVYCSNNHEISNSPGVSIGGSNNMRMRLFGGTTYNTVELMQGSSNLGMGICYSSSGSTSTFKPSSNTVKAMCRWAGYGSNAYGYSTSTTGTPTGGALYDYISCPSTASSISQCTVRKPTASNICNRYVTIRCYTGSSSSPSSSPPSKSHFPTTALIVPVVWCVLIVGFFVWRKSRMGGVGAGSGFFSTRNALDNSHETEGPNRANTTTTNYQNFNSSSSPGSPNNNIQFQPQVGTPMSPMQYQNNNMPPPPPPAGYNYQPPQNWNGNGNGAPPPPPPPANFAAGTMPGMTTFDNVGAGDNVPPPPGGYGFMPGFGGDPQQQQQYGNYPPPPPPGGGY